MQYPTELYCGWSNANTSFRSIVCWLVVVAGIAVFVGMRWDSRRILFWCWFTFMLCSVSMVSVLTLDANSVRVGDSYCANKAQLPSPLSWECPKLSWIGLCAADGASVMLLWATYLATKAMYKVIRKRQAGVGGTPVKLEDDVTNAA